MAKIIGIVFVLLCVSCASWRVQPERETTFLPQDIKYQEYNGVATVYWASPDFKIKDYPKVMIDPVILKLSDGFAEKEGIKTQEAQEVADFLYQRLVDDFRKAGRLTDKAGVGVARIKIALTDLMPSARFFNTLSTITPVGAVISFGRWAFTGKPSDVGEVELAMTFSDSVTDKITVAVKTRQTGSKIDFSGHIDRLGNARTELEKIAQAVVDAWQTNNPQK